MIGEKHLHGKAAALDVRLDQGHVAAARVPAAWRGQPFGTLRVLFNSALYTRPPASDVIDGPAKAGHYD